VRLKSGGEKRHIDLGPGTAWFKVERQESGDLELASGT